MGDRSIFLSFALIDKWVNANGRTTPYFFMHPEGYAIIQEAIRLGYVERISQMQVRWTSQGIINAKRDLK